MATVVSKPPFANRVLRCSGQYENVNVAALQTYENCRPSNTPSPSSYKNCRSRTDTPETGHRGNQPEFSTIPSYPSAGSLAGSPGRGGDQGKPGTDTQKSYTSGSCTSVSVQVLQLIHTFLFALFTFVSFFTYLLTSQFIYFHFAIISSLFCFHLHQSSYNQLSTSCTKAILFRFSEKLYQFFSKSQGFLDSQLVI